MAVPQTEGLIIERSGYALFREIMSQAEVGSLVDLSGKRGRPLGVWLVGSKTLWDMSEIIPATESRTPPSDIYTEICAWHYHATSHFRMLDDERRARAVAILKRKAAEGRFLHKFLTREICASSV